MFKKIKEGYMRSTLFEKLLGVVGLSILIVGIWFFDKVYLNDSIIDLNLVQTFLLWGILILLVIQVDASERVKEDLGIIIREHLEETKLLKNEVSLMKDEMTLLKEIEREELEVLRRVKGKKK